VNLTRSLAFDLLAAAGVALLLAVACLRYEPAGRDEPGSSAAHADG